MRFFKTSFQKKPWSRIFSEIFSFDENVDENPAQLLAKTWCPYLLWVLRNLPHKFEKLAYVMKSTKKKTCRAWARTETLNGLLKVIQKG